MIVVGQGPSTGVGFDRAYAGPAVGPETRYAMATDGVHIAYQVVGDGPPDVVMVPGFVSNVELAWDLPFIAPALERVASFGRLIRFDKRGTGLSDRVGDAPSLEQRMDDVRAVMDAAGSDGAALWGISEGGPLCLLFAATYPDRVAALVLEGSFACIIRKDDYPWGYSLEEGETIRQMWEQQWGTGAALAAFFPTLADDPDAMALMARYERNSASPSVMGDVISQASEIDVRHVLSAISARTLVLHSADDAVIPVECGRFLAEHIPDARIVEHPGADHLGLTNETRSLDAIEEFLTGVPPTPKINRELATVVFTDIVGSTPQVALLGDARWREILDSHDAALRHELARFRGREVKTTGDGFLAAFDGPARAVRYAVAASQAVRPLGLEIRAGIHTGECERRGDDLGGIAVHLGARICDLADPGEVLASRTVTDLVAGSGLSFVDRGEHELKGVPGRWRLYAADG